MSDNIFAEIYNRILSLFGQNVKDESKNTAVNRLRLVLMQDRTNLTPEIMNRMRSELIGVLSKYVELDKEALDLNIGQEGEQMALMLSIPVIRAKDEAEIEQAIKEEEEAKKAAEEKTENEEGEETEAAEDNNETEETSDIENSEETNDSNQKETEAPEKEDDETDFEEVSEKKSKNKEKNKAETVKNETKEEDKTSDSGKEIKEDSEK
ncbi:cell division topological specificity factor MinE [bacterium]|nr:cell division topological specificity factor MinE [bacterium]